MKVTGGSGLHYKKTITAPPGLKAILPAASYYRRKPIV